MSAIFVFVCSVCLQWQLCYASCVRSASEGARAGNVVSMTTFGVMSFLAAPRTVAELADVSLEMMLKALGDRPTLFNKVTLSAALYKVFGSLEIPLDIFDDLLGRLNKVNSFDDLIDALLPSTKQASPDVKTGGRYLADVDARASVKNKIKAREALDDVEIGIIDEIPVKIQSTTRENLIQVFKNQAGNRQNAEIILEKLSTTSKAKPYSTGLITEIQTKLAEQITLPSSSRVKIGSKISIDHISAGLGSHMATNEGSPAWLIKAISDLQPGKSLEIRPVDLFDIDRTSFPNEPMFPKNIQKGLTVNDQAILGQNLQIQDWKASIIDNNTLLLTSSYPVNEMANGLQRTGYILRAPGVQRSFIACMLSDFFAWLKNLFTVRSK